MKRMILANELIGFQDDRFFKLLTPLFTDAREKLQAAKSPSEKIDIKADLCARMSGVIADVTNMTVYIYTNESKEINAAYGIVSLTRDNVHTSATGKFDNQSQRIKMYVSELAKKKSLVTESMVSVSSSKVYGEFSRIPFQITVSSELITSDKLNDRERAFLIIHECGHPFNILASIAETCVMGYNLGLAFDKMMKADRSEFKIILDDTSKKTGYSSPAVVREACDGKDAVTAFRVYSSMMIRDKFASSFDPSGKFNMPSIETAADSFAIRHGGYREFLKMRTSILASGYSKHYNLAIIGKYIAGKVMEDVFSNTVGTYAATKGVTAMALTGVTLASGFMMSIVTGILFTGVTFNKVLMDKSEKLVTAADHAAFLKRELSERSKADNLSKEDLQFCLDLLSEADEIVKTTDKQEPAVIRVLDMLIRSEGSRAIKDYADAQASLISNELFLKAKELHSIA